MTRSRLMAIPILAIATVMIAAATAAVIRDGFQGWTAPTAVIGGVLFFSGVALAARKT